jgi:hypothetical protein
MVQTVADIVARLPQVKIQKLLPPAYRKEVLDNPRRLGLAVESMKRHMTDEGWQIFKGLGEAGWELAGYDLPINSTYVPAILHVHKPDVVLMQDKREWDITSRDFREPNARFARVNILKECPNIFKGTILKDAQQRPHYHRESADEIGCHFWVIYYNLDIVCKLAPYVRREHCIRTWHTVDPQLVPVFSPEGRKPCYFSGAISGAYPLRQRIVKWMQEGKLLNIEYHKHPGYHRSGCATGRYLQTLSQYKVAICTSSMYGYALRKIIEATACGCRVITDLPIDERMPFIDDNLQRVSPDISPEELNRTIFALCETYCPEKQEIKAFQAKKFYDYRYQTIRLNTDIENLRREYPCC